MKHHLLTILRCLTFVVLALLPTGIVSAQVAVHYPASGATCLPNSTTELPFTMVANITTFFPYPNLQVIPITIDVGPIGRGAAGQWLYYRAWAAAWFDGKWNYQPGSWISAYNEAPGMASHTETWRSDNNMKSWYKLDDGWLLLTPFHIIGSLVQLKLPGTYWLGGEYRWGPGLDFDGTVLLNNNGTAVYPGDSRFSWETTVNCYY